MSSANFRFPIGLPPIDIDGIILSYTSDMISSRNILKITPISIHACRIPTVVFNEFPKCLLTMRALQLLLYKCLNIVINLLMDITLLKFYPHSFMIDSVKFLPEMNEVVKKFHLGINTIFYKCSDICNLIYRTSAFQKPCLFLRYNLFMLGC